MQYAPAPFGFVASSDRDMIYHVCDSIGQIAVAHEFAVIYICFGSQGSIESVWASDFSADAISQPVSQIVPSAPDFGCSGFIDDRGCIEIVAPV